MEHIAPSSEMTEQDEGAGQKTVVTYLLHESWDMEHDCGERNYVSILARSPRGSTCIKKIKKKLTPGWLFSLKESRDQAVGYAPWRHVIFNHFTHGGRLPRAREKDWSRCGDQRVDRVLAIILLGISGLQLVCKVGDLQE